MSEIKQPTFDIPFKSPLAPELLGPDDKIKFRCYKGISCFNACCRKADIQLTPYDIVRLKTRLGMDSSEFLKKYTVPAPMDAHGLPAVKMRTEDEDPVCLLLNADEGCSVYEDRPSACRYYPVGLMNMRALGSPTDEQHYFVVQEDHCMGHSEDNEMSIDQYREEQGVKPFDELNHEWYQIILKKRSSGPTVGKPSEMSLQLFFMCSYDVDRFRRFVMSDAFKNSYDLDDSFFAEVENDDVALMQFGFKLMKQVLFGEQTVPEREGALGKRLDERKEIIETRKAAALQDWTENNDIYKMDQEGLQQEKASKEKK
ncbi:MAG: YkgJ family cysteine cluster protein [Gammaproteobacteria bacterium]|nr:MAG: YkgJ family cysteine cluster protein [Gammaproteobacteria bacterium]